MKLSGLLLFPLLALAIPAPEALAAPEAAPVPMPEANPRPEPGKLVARANMTCKTTADGVRYRTCASTSCTAVGQYPIGKSVTFTCWKYGECIHGDCRWLKATNGYYSSFYYFGSCTSSWPPAC